LNLAKKFPSLLAMENTPNSLHFLICDFKLLLEKKIVNKKKVDWSHIYDNEKYS
jgi:hypothetical protein